MEEDKDPLGTIRMSTV